MKVGADTVIPFSSVGAKLVGRYTSNATIDVSSYGATSASQFLAVSETTNGQYTSPYASGSASYWNVYGKYTAPSLSLNSAHTQLTLTIGTLWAQDLFTDGRHSFTKNCPCKIYFVGDIT